MTPDLIQGCTHPRGKLETTGSEQSQMGFVESVFAGGLRLAGLSGARSGASISASDIIRHGRGLSLVALAAVTHFYSYTFAPRNTSSAASRRDHSIGSTRPRQLPPLRCPASLPVGRLARASPWSGRRANSNYSLPGRRTLDDGSRINRRKKFIK